MKIYTLVINDEVNNISPVYEVHSWDKAEEIIKNTMELSDKSFTFQVFGRVDR